MNKSTFAGVGPCFRICYFVFESEEVIFRSNLTLAPAEVNDIFGSF